MNNSCFSLISLLILFTFLFNSCKDRGINGQHNIEYTFQLSDSQVENTIQVLQDRLHSYGFTPKQIAFNTISSNQIKVQVKNIDDPKKVRTLLLERTHFFISACTLTKEWQESEMLQQIEDALLSSEEDSMTENSQPPISKLLKPSQTNGDLAYAIAKDTAKINQYLKLEVIKSLFPNTLKFFWGKFESHSINGEMHHALYAADLKSNDLVIDNKDVEEVGVEQNPYGQFILSMKLKEHSHQKWANLTAANIKKPLIICIGGKVYSAPIVMEKITGGSLQVSGNFSEKEATNLANQLGGGYLPSKIELISEQAINP